MGTAALLAVLAAPAGATDYYLGALDSLAVDQPRITFGLTDESTNPGTLIGPTLLNLALLDTGANGILLGTNSFANGEDYSQAIYNDPVHGPTPATYDEQGVAGFQTLEIYDPHGLRIVDAASNELLIATDLVAFGGANINLGSFAAIVGMPAMAGHVVEIDMRPTLSLEFQEVYFHSTPNQPVFESAATLDVELRIVPPEWTDTDLPEAYRPTFAGLPVIDNMAMTHTGGANSGGATLTTSDTFLVDTGAQTMIISSQMANNMGMDVFFDPDDENAPVGADIVDFLEVGGIGGTAFMPLVVVDELRLPTTDGLDLVFTDILAGVLDIEGAPFDAVMGMNMLTSGYTNAIFGGGGGDTLTNGAFDKDTVEFFIDTGTVGSVQDLHDLGIITIGQEDFDLLVELGLLTNPTDPQTVFCELRTLDEAAGAEGDAPYFDKVIFDFTPTDGSATMSLHLSALEEDGDANYDGHVGDEDLAIVLANWGQSVRIGSVLDGDLTGDGIVGLGDLQAILDNWSEGTPPDVNVPEPASALLLLAGGALLLRRRRSA